MQQVRATPAPKKRPLEATRASKMLVFVSVDFSRTVPLAINAPKGDHMNKKHEFLAPSDLMEAREGVAAAARPRSLQRPWWARGPTATKRPVDWYVSSLRLLVRGFPPVPLGLAPQRPATGEP